jgi:hypothetical protein
MRPDPASADGLPAKRSCCCRCRKTGSESPRSATRGSELTVTILKLGSLFLQKYRANVSVVLDRNQLYRDNQAVRNIESVIAAIRDPLNGRFMVALPTEARWSMAEKVVAFLTHPV